MIGQMFIRGCLHYNISSHDLSGMSAETFTGMFHSSSSQVNYQVPGTWYSGAGYRYPSPKYNFLYIHGPVYIIPNIKPVV